LAHEISDSFFSRDWFFAAEGEGVEIRWVSLPAWADDSFEARAES
jgi:hypothetical protein